MIIGILAIIALPTYQNNVNKAKWVEAINTIGQIKRAVEVYYMQYGFYSHVLGDHLYLNGPRASTSHGLLLEVPPYPTATKFIYALLAKDYFLSGATYQDHKYDVFAFIDKNSNGQHDSGDPVIQLFDTGSFGSAYGAPKF